MKLLHIGNPDCLNRYTEQTDFTRSVQVVDLVQGLPAECYLKEASDADVIVADAMAPVSAELINSMKNLKLIHSEGVGYNFIDLSAADQNGVYVCNSAGMNAQAVAEQTVLLMLGVLRNVACNDRAVREGRQIEVKSGYMAEGSLRDLADCRVGLIGFGNIGQAAARILHAFGSELYYTQRHRADEKIEQKYGCRWCADKEELLKTCDIVSMHLPVTKETEHMCNDAFFSAMKNGSYFINTSRGELVDDQALVNALQTGKLIMAGLDTLNDEPVKKTHILLDQPEEVERKILFSPHIGGITSTSFRVSYRIIWNNIQRISNGEEPVNIVNMRAHTH